MSITPSENWASNNPPPTDSADLTSPDQGDLAQGLLCGEPIRVGALNWFLHKLGQCIIAFQNEIPNLSSKAGLTYDDTVTTNLSDAVCALICDSINNSRDKGIRTGSFTEGDTATVTYSTTFASTPVPVISPLFNGATNTVGDAWWQINQASISATGFTATMQATDAAATSTGFTWIAQTDCQI